MDGERGSADRALTDRVGRLERSNRRWRAGAIALGAAMVLGGAGGGSPGIVKARSFSLVDEDGTARATMMMSFGNPAIVFYDRRSMPRLFIDMGADGSPGIHLHDSGNHDRLEVGLFDGEEPRVVLKNKAARVVAELKP